MSHPFFSHFPRFFLLLFVLCETTGGPSGFTSFNLLAVHVNNRNVGPQGEVSTMKSRRSFQAQGSHQWQVELPTHTADAPSVRKARVK